MKLKKGDTVLVISGKDKKRTAKILRAFPKEGMILIDGINLKSKHLRPKKQGEKGQVIKIPLPMTVANVKLVCPKCSKAVRVGYKISDGKKFRVCKKCQSEV